MDEKDRNIARTTAWSVLFPKETEEQHNENKLLIEASMNRLKEISTHIL
jgi:hypothetical protein